MEIRFMSSLTHEDEDRVASALLRAAGELLDLLPIAYSIRIETAAAKIFEHHHTPEIEPMTSKLPAVVARFDGRVLPGPGTPR